jgi:sugar phosphate isomerase/epimerase
VLGTGTSKNVLKWEPKEVAEAKRLLSGFGLSVAEFGSPIGKVKLRDKDDGTKNRFVPFTEYLVEVEQALNLAQEFGAKRFRCFSFYPPADEPPENHLSQAAEQLAAIVERCPQRGLVGGNEVEANLVGRNGALCAELAKRVNSPYFRNVFDAGNLTVQNMPAEVVLGHFQTMVQTLGWMHVKDYRIDPALTWKGVVDEERLANFVPCTRGDSGHPAILMRLGAHLDALSASLHPLGVTDGFLLTLEPHLKKGGQFGGFSGADGMGVALRELLRLLTYLGLETDLRGFEDVLASRDQRP